MKTAKKTIKTILALLPLMGLFMLFLTSFNAKTEKYPQHSSVAFNYSVSAGKGNFVFSTPSAINAKILGTLYSDEYIISDNGQSTTAQNVNGTLATVARFANTLTTITGIPITYTAVSLWYTFYLFMIELAFMIMNIVTFVPRKCSEFFGGQL